MKIYFDKKNLKFHKLWFQKVFFILSLYAFLFSCKKDEVEPIITFPQYDSVADIEKHYYKTVKIGNQWWMAENLQVKSFNDGSPIYDGQADTNWVKKLPMYCVYRENEIAPGLLYNWNAVTDAKGIAPAGWHVASEADWQTLESYIGMSATEIQKFGWRGTQEGSKIKAEGKTGWATDIENWPSNASGFQAYAGSCRLFNAQWGEPGLYATGFWWAATQYNDEKAYYRYLDYKNTQIFRYYDNKGYGFSVRCVKD